jgi:hypothetical protein
MGLIVSGPYLFIKSPRPWRTADLTMNFHHLSSSGYRPMTRVVPGY